MMAGVRLESEWKTPVERDVAFIVLIGVSHDCYWKKRCGNWQYWLLSFLVGIHSSVNYHKVKTSCWTSASAVTSRGTEFKYWPRDWLSLFLPCFPPYLLKFIIHESSCSSALCGLSCRLTNFMELSIWEANSFSASQDAVFTRTCHCPQPRARWIQSSTLHPVFLNLF
jgi:hypothetical protein